MQYSSKFLKPPKFARGSLPELCIKDQDKTLENSQKSWIKLEKYLGEVLGLSVLVAVNARTPPQILGWSSHKSLWKRSEFSCFHRESLLKNWFCASSPLWQREGWSERKIEIYLILIHLYWLFLNDPRDWFSEGRSGQRAGVGPVIRARRDQTGGIKDIKLDHSVLNSRKKTFLRMVFSEKNDRKLKKILTMRLKTVLCVRMGNEVLWILIM